MINNQNRDLLSPSKKIP